MTTADDHDPPGHDPLADTLAADDPDFDEHFKPTGTLFILGLFVATLILLWLSVYVILLSRGVTL